MSTAPKVIWNPADYATNSASQLAWALELMGRMHLQGDEHVLDVGCGDGKVTAELAGNLPRGAVLGIDASPEMLRFARRTFPQSRIPHLKFRTMDARHIRLAQRFDVVFSNATLHWVDDHPAFLRGAAACLRPGGRLLVSCGGKGNAQDVFQSLRAVMRLKRFRAFFRRMTTPYFFYRPEDYEKWLPQFGFEPRTVRLAEKTTSLPGRDGLAAWFRTTWLPYTQRVPAELRDELVRAVVDRYVAKHAPGAQGQLRVRMVRLEIDAVKIGNMQTHPGTKRAAIYHP